MASPSRPHLVVFPYPALGHITPCLHLVSALSSTFEITFVTTTYYIDRAKQIIANDHPNLANIVVVGLSEGLPEGEGSTDNLPKLAEASEGPILSRGLDDLVVKIQKREHLVALITDTFLGWTQDIANSRGVPRFIFYTPPATVLSLMLHLEEFNKDGLLEPNTGKPIFIPGFPNTLQLSDLPSHLQDSTKYMYGYFLRHSARVKEAAGILCNTVYELERDVIDALRTEVPQAKNLPIWTGGPMLASSFFKLPSVEAESNPIESVQGVPEVDECLSWLDRQEKNAVIYISFGSIAVLTETQIAYLARALLYTKRKFLWVLRQPEGSVSSLPDGFLEQTKEQGLIVKWSPQPKVLAHPAVRVFLTHCGWGSTLEAITLGKPLIAWPCFAEQKLNTRYLVDVLQVALEVKKDQHGLADTSVIAEVIDKFYSDEGEVITRKMANYGELVRAAVREGGSSKQGLEAFKRAILKYSESQ